MNTMRLPQVAILILGGLLHVTSHGSVGRQRDSDQPVLYDTLYLTVNTTSPPFDNVLVRYALAMATDRRAIASAMRDKRFKYFPGIGLVPPFKGYETLSHLEVEVEGKTYDVLAYNPGAARELLAKAGFPYEASKDKGKLAVGVLVDTGENTQILVAAIKQQWEENLGIDVKMTRMEWRQYLSQKSERAFEGVALDGKALLLSDAGNLLDFATGQIRRKPCWVDAQFSRMLEEAHRASSSNAAEGNRKFRECEAYLLRAMAVIPLYSYAP